MTSKDGRDQAGLGAHSANSPTARADTADAAREWDARRPDDPFMDGGQPLTRVRRTVQIGGSGAK